jgi:vacuolar-type H+-ATPase subunit E/Vma4
MSTMTEEDRIQALEKEILAQADVRAAETISRAERVANRIARGAKRRADEITREAQRRLGPRIEAERARALALVELEMKRREASVKEEIVAKAFADARAELSARSEGGDGLAVLARFISDAVAALPGSDFGVELAPSDLEHAGPTWLSSLADELSSRLGRTVRLKAASSDAAPSGGVRVTSADGRTCVDQTFDARLALVGDELRRAIHRSLFEAAVEPQDNREQVT